MLRGSVCLRGVERKGVNYADTTRGVIDHRPAARSSVCGIGAGVGHRRGERLLGGGAARGHRRSREPELIEKVRTALTDDSGRYRIVDLRAGTYTVTFSLPGFGSVRREGIALTGTFTATIDAELKVGTLEETVTVTGESPIVDVQSIRRQTVHRQRDLEFDSRTRSYNRLMQLMPNTVTQAGAASDVQIVPGMVVFGGAGGRSNEGRVNIDGISVGSAFNGAGVSHTSRRRQRARDRDDDLRRPG